jgi:hypothetical protein
MIPDIGMMIGAYIFVRMISFLTRTGEQKESIVVKIFAVITILITIICTFDLLIHGTTSMPSYSR